MKVRVVIALSVAVALAVVVSVAKDASVGNGNEAMVTPHDVSGVLPDVAEPTAHDDQSTEENEAACGQGNPHSHYIDCGSFLDLCIDNDGLQDECCFPQDPPCSGPCQEPDCGEHEYDQNPEPIFAFAMAETRLALNLAQRSS